MTSSSAPMYMPTHPQPKPLRGFSHINRYWDKRQGVYAAKILPGQFYVSREGEMVVTVLGSCISACIRDPVNRVGGMNHFMLPIQRNNMSPSGVASLTPGSVSEAARYGNWAMEYLINEILKNGGERGNLEVKVFGGGKVLSHMNQIDVGKQNIDFVRLYLEQEGFRVAAHDVGGPFPRKVLYFTDTGSAKVRKLRSVSNETVYEREVSYQQNINSEPATGSIELFD
ncbi:MAG: chemoreceptor glutamine deamidase CheD [Ketobacteraceae bacterium]|nr:chemoreceptor glutamine deamidase CheD [Ketobacteraceae bacterium]